MESRQLFMLARNGRSALRQVYKRTNLRRGCLLMPLSEVCSCVPMRLESQEKINLCADRFPNRSGRQRAYFFL